MNDQKILVLGIGNPLFGDDGFGVAVVAALAAAEPPLPETVRLLDGGTQGLYLLPEVTGCERLLLLDALDCGLPAGSMQVLERDAVPRYHAALKLGPHQTGFQEVLSAAELMGKLPSDLVVIGVQPAVTALTRDGLSPAVQAQVGPAAAEARRVLLRWGAR